MTVANTAFAAFQMAVYFVTRHPGARDWASEEGLTVDHVVNHLDPPTIDHGDVVIGTLPVHLAAEVCARGARYLHLSLQIPPALRGKELSTTQMRDCGARIEEYRVVQIRRAHGAETQAD